MSTDTQIDDVMLDETLDDLADLPQVAPYPAGSHLAKMIITKKPAKKDSKGVMGQPSYQGMFEYIEAKELANPNATAPNPGDKAFVNIYTKKKDGTPNEIGQGQLKVLVGPICERIDSKSVNDAILATKDGVEVMITTGMQKGGEGYDDKMTILKLLLA